MYFPYFRGKQYELIAIRECIESFKKGTVTPVIEPVREKSSTLEKTLDILVEQNIPFVLIINPRHGDFKNNNKLLVKLIEKKWAEYDNLHFGYIVDSKSTIVDIESFLHDYSTRFNVTLVHSDFPKGKELASVINETHKVLRHIFIDGPTTGRLYQKHFKTDDVETVLVKDGFIKKKNSAYEEEDAFSELHLTYREEGYSGFGDFLIVGDDYSDSGGAAYAVTIHLSYIAKEDEDIMRVKHFVSDRTDSPVDPAGKFLEALDKLKTEVDEGKDIDKTKAVEEFLELHKKGHFPGLGYAKKISMKHHVQILSSYLVKES